MIVGKTALCPLALISVTRKLGSEKKCGHLGG